MSGPEFRLPDYLGGAEVVVGDETESLVTVYVIRPDGTRAPVRLNFTHLVLAPVVAKPQRHYRTGPGKCFCGFDAYKISGIMVDYHAELLDHLSRVERAWS